MGENNSHLQGEIVSVENAPVLSAENPERESLSVAIEDRRFSGLRDFANKSLFLICAFAVGGYSQWSVEIDKVLGIIPNDSPGKFANGMVDFNPTEEILEGGIPAVVGAVTMLGIIRHLSKNSEVKLEPRQEAMFMSFGAGLGYAAMAVGGAFLHDLLNVPDVKWGPFQ